MKKNQIELDKEIINKKLFNLEVMSNLKQLFIKIIFFLFFLFIIFFVIFGIHRMKDMSMAPIIGAGDLVIYYRLDKNYQPGDVVVIDNNGKNSVFRIVAIEGQVVKIDDDSNLYINNHLETNILYYKNNFKDNKIKYPFVVPKDEIFVLEDYRLDINDSRTFGSINENKIKGSVVSVFKTKNI